MFMLFYLISSKLQMRKLADKYMHGTMWHGSHWWVLFAWGDDSLYND